jgi:hypothetical protein
MKYRSFEELIGFPRKSMKLKKKPVTGRGGV